LHNSASVISVANSALVNHGSREWLQIASSSGVVAESLVAGSNQSLNSGNCEAIQRREGTSSNRHAEILSAVVIVETSDVGVNTSGLWVASISSAISVIVAEAGSINIGVDAHGGSGIASVDLAHVSSVAIVLGVLAHSSGGIARVISAEVSIVTVDWSGNTETGVRIADVVLARNRGASDVDAHVARSRGEQNVLASSLVGVARIGVARISLVAVEGGVGASNGGITSSSVANISCGTSDGRERASSNWITSSLLAEVSVSAWLSSVDASVSVNVGSANFVCAHVVVLASRWADAGSSARAESVASSSARVSLNSLASGGNKSVENSLESSEAGNGGISGLNSWNSGGKGNELRGIDGSTNSKREDEDSCSFNLVDDLIELVESYVIHSVREHNNDVRNSGLIPSSVGHEFIVGQLKSATDTSVSWVLVDFGHGVKEGGLSISHVDGVTSGSGELHQSHSNSGWGERVALSQRCSKLHFLNKVGSADGSRLVEYQDEIDLLVANGSRATPSINNSKGIRIVSSDHRKVYSLSVTPLSSANSGSRSPNIGNNVSRNGIMVASNSVKSNSSSSRRAIVILWHLSGPALSLASRAVQVPQFLVIIN